MVKEASDTGPEQSLASRPVISQRIKIGKGIDATELSRTVVLLAEEQEHRGFRTFLPGEIYGKEGSKFVLKIVLDPENPDKDLIIRPGSNQTFRTGFNAGRALILESSYQMSQAWEEATPPPELANELYTAANALSGALQERLA